MGPTPRSMSGFTLLELLLTLSLFAIVMMLSLNSFFQFNDQADIMNERISIRQEARLLERMIRNDLKSVVYLKEFVAYNQASQIVINERKSGLIGLNDQVGEHDRDTVHMHVNRPSSFYRYLSPSEDPELYEVSYYVTDDEGDGARLNRREEFYVDDDMTDGDESVIHVISENIVSFDLKYFSGSDEEPVNEWESSEKKAGTLGVLGIPSGVMVSFVLKNESGSTFQKSFQVNLQPVLSGAIQWD